MQKTEEINLDIDLISEKLYRALIKEFKKTRQDVVYINEIKISAIVEFEE